MVNNHQSNHMPVSSDEDSTARLLRIAARRPGVPADRLERVRSAVHLEWHAAVRRRTVRRRAVASAALLAAAAGLVLAFRTTVPRVDAPPEAREIVARVERVEGQARRTIDARGDYLSTINLSSNDDVPSGEWVETDATSGVALRLTGGTSLRLDTGTRARLVSATAVELIDGGVYVDTGHVSPGIEVRTPVGTAHDIGTQFEVRVGARSLRVRVRTGAVEVRHGDRAIPAPAGTELTVAEGRAVTARVSPFGPEWEWAVRAALAFEIEGRPLAAFLEHLAREQGWTLKYASPALARDASSIILHGSVEGLQPREALGVALATSGLSHRFRDGELSIMRPMDLR